MQLSFLVSTYILCLFIFSITCGVIFSNLFVTIGKLVVQELTINKGTNLILILAISLFLLILIGWFTHSVYKRLITKSVRLNFFRNVFQSLNEIEEEPQEFIEDLQFQTSRALKKMDDFFWLMYYGGIILVECGYCMINFQWDVVLYTIGAVLLVVLPQLALLLLNDNNPYTHSNRFALNSFHCNMQIHQHLGITEVIKTFEKAESKAAKSVMKYDAQVASIRALGYGIRLILEAGMVYLFVHRSSVRIKFLIMFHDVLGNACAIIPFSYGFKLVSLLKYAKSDSTLEDLHDQYRTKLNADVQNHVLEIRVDTISNRKSVLLQDLHLQMDTEQTTVLEGESGIGKSTLVSKILNGDIVKLDGEIRDYKTLSCESVCVTQFPNLMNKSVFENIGMFYGGESMLTAEHQRIIVACAQLAKCEELLEYPRVGHLGRKLSGGQIRRVAIAQALVPIMEGWKKILILDEPACGLSAAQGLELMRNICTLCKEKRVILIVITHNESIKALCEQRIDLQKYVPAEEMFVIGVRTSTESESVESAC